MYKKAGDYIPSLNYAYQIAAIKIRVDFNGNRIGQPEIIETFIHCNDGLDKLAKIYARMIKNDQDLVDQEEGSITYGK